MPGTRLRMAASITVEPFSASTSWRAPFGSMKVMRAIAGWGRVGRSPRFAVRSRPCQAGSRPGAHWPRRADATVPSPSARPAGEADNGVQALGAFLRIARLPHPDEKALDPGDGEDLRLERL